MGENDQTEPVGLPLWAGVPWEWKGAPEPTTELVPVSGLPFVTTASGAPALEPVVVYRTRLRRRVAIWSLVVVLLATTGGGAWFSWHYNQIAGRWRQDDLLQISQTTTANKQVSVANTNLSTLHGQIRTLDQTVTSLQGQLSAVANQKEKALDTTAVLNQLLSDASTVADRLDSCVNDTDTFISDLQSTTDTFFSSLLEAEAQSVDQECNSAEQANQALQSDIASAP